MTDEDVVDQILEAEGRIYTNRAADRGGPTKFGITLDTLSNWRNRRVTADEVEALEESEAREIYRAWYVDRWDWVPDDRLRVLLIDWGVTTSLHRVVSELQAVVKADVDGVLGPQTQQLTKAALMRDADDLYTAVLVARMRFYVNLALNDPALRPILTVNRKLQILNMRGWLNRCFEFL